MGYIHQIISSIKGVGRGGSDESPFQRQNFLKLKITPNLTALELSGSYLPIGAPLYYSLGSQHIYAEPLQIISIASRDQLHT